MGTKQGWWYVPPKRKGKRDFRVKRKYYGYQHANELKYVVCGSDRWGDNRQLTGKCNRCGREVWIPAEFSMVKVRYCILCDPQLPELLREENDGEVDKNKETAYL